jgi:hypothetical protein
MLYNRGMKRGSKHSSYGQANYTGIPDTPSGNLGLFLAAIERAKLSKDISGEYSKLPDGAKAEFSLRTFERKVEEA